MKSSAVGFEFPCDSSGQWDGFNEPGIEHFSGNPFEHLGREVPQNTIDATASQGGAARINIKLLKIASAEIPSVAELKAALQSCFNGAEAEGEKARAFFEAALKVVEERKIGILQISDHNTTGLVGPCENGKPYFAMMKATGQSKKSGTATGSFGIGKFAPFTVSALRTVFVTTVWKDVHGDHHHYVQGKSILMSHEDAEGGLRRGTGFWGIRQNCLPVEAPTMVPAWLRRTATDLSLEGQVGTTLSILGFNAKGDWQKSLAANIAENFFGAIHEGKLEVYIEDGPIITRESLPGLLTDVGLASAVADQKGEPEKFNNVRSYYRALTEISGVFTEETENQHLGKCQLKLLIGENLPKKVAVLRNGMLITDELARLKRFTPYKEFVAVLECRAEKGLSLLRAMEPPRHDDFEVERLSPERKRAGRIALAEIATWVRQMLDRHAKDPVSEVTTLDELADYFGDEDEGGSGRKRDENPGGAIVFRQRPVKMKTRIAIPAGPLPSDDSSEDGDDVDADGFGSTTIGGGQGTPDNDRSSPVGGGAQRDASEAGNRDAGDAGDAEKDGGGRTGGNARPSLIGVPLQNVRAVPLGPGHRRVAFTPAISGTVSIELQDSGADTNYRLEVLAATVGEIRSGTICNVSVEAGERCVFEVELDPAFNGTLRVVANAV